MDVGSNDVAGDIIICPVLDVSTSIFIASAVNKIRYNWNYLKKLVHFWFSGSLSNL